MEKLDNLIADLRSPSQRLIRISFGTNTAITPIPVQQITLESISPYFKRALDENGFNVGINGSLNLPEDEFDVWKVILYWAFKHDLPGPHQAKNLHLAVRCWIVGDKYEIKRFQDCVMLRMLRRLDSMHFALELLGTDVLLLVLKHAPRKSLLQELVLDWVAVKMHKHNIGSFEEVLLDVAAEPFEDSVTTLETLDGTGFYPAMLAKRPWLNYGNELMWRPSNCNHDEPSWTNFFLDSSSMFDCTCDGCE
ncbi:hypothetical protein TI39_contig348g00011 [Zymoseptoria brevis]|uniref:BTB domain-containing protein n=1 Tax=Zymoseptoria brevis TaxID=1047168 RepID=A0A0F4GUM0_9PEZI|nr:hypothetical protein TI39_contig348g00011 [Zymoseptoria brevis]